MKLMTKMLDGLDALLAKANGRKSKRTVFGRLRAPVEIAPPVLDLATGKVREAAPTNDYVFELKRDGLHVRRLRQRRSGERVWPFQLLVEMAPEIEKAAARKAKLPDPNQMNLL